LAHDDVIVEGTVWSVITGLNSTGFCKKKSFAWNFLQDLREKKDSSINSIPKLVFNFRPRLPNIVGFRLYNYGRSKILTLWKITKTLLKILVYVYSDWISGHKSPQQQKSDCIRRGRGARPYFHGYGTAGCRRSQDNRDT